MHTATPHRRRLSDASRSTVETQLVRLEERLAQLRAQVRQAQQLSILGTAAATIAHEFNNLLTPLVAYSEFALEKHDPDLCRRAAELTVRNGQVLVALTNHLLRLVAARAPHFGPVQVRVAAQDAAACLCRDLSKDGISFMVEVDESVHVRTDAHYLQQVFFNLFLNAREAMARVHNGRLVVRATTEAARVSITVRDNGPGIPADLLPHIFEPFTSSKSGNGNVDRCKGLGLPLCRELVEESGGTISVTSEPGQGTVFTITLPAAVPAQALGATLLDARSAFASLFEPAGM